MMSQPSAARAIVSNWLATKAAMASTNWDWRPGDGGTGVAGRLATAALRTSCNGDAEAVDPVVEVGRHAQADLLTERPQLRRQRYQRLDIAPRPDCRQQHAHVTPLGRGLVSRWMGAS
jgi:hypothetical protein